MVFSVNAEKSISYRDDEVHSDVTRSNLSQSVQKSLLGKPYLEQENLHYRIPTDQTSSWSCRACMERLNLNGTIHRCVM